MAEKNAKPKEKKRRFYHNLKDAYNITKRTYRWIGWVMLASFIIPAVGGICLGIWRNHYFSFPIGGISLGLMLALIELTVLVKKAMYTQIEGRPGVVGSVLSQIKRGWIINDQPIAATKAQDVVWRIVGRPGIVLISEGPTSRVTKLLEDERRKVNRVAPNVPVHLLSVGTNEDQIPLAKLIKTINKLKKHLSRNEVPVVDKRLASLTNKGLPIPKGVDPTKVKMNRRALRGR